MPITPAPVGPLLKAYDRLVNANQDLVGAVADVAPAAVREVLCQLGGLASLGAGPLGPLQSPGTGNRTLSDAGGILQAACPVPPPLPEPLPPPFEGGQCPGVLYTVRTNLKRQNLDNCNEFETAFDVGNVPGPVGQPFPVEFVENPCNDSEIGRVWNWTTGAGTVLFRSESSQVGLQNVEILEVIRQDGLPDDCGNPPSPEPTRPPITQPPPSPEIPTINPDGSPGSPIIITPRVGPIFIDASANIKVPVTVEISGPDIDVNTTIPVSVSLPDFNVDFEFGGTGGGAGGEGGEEPTPPSPICCPPPPPELQPAPEEDPGEDPEDPPPPNRRRVGVVVSTVEVGETAAGTTVFTANPPLRVPRVATVQFEIEVGGTTSLSADTQVKSLNQYVEGPRNGKITRAFVGWEPGWEGSFSYVEVPINGSE